MKNILLLLLCCFMPIFAEQKLADKPNDKPITIQDSSGNTYCYAPVFTKGDAYVYIDNCDSKAVKPARYDVFQRIAYNIDNVWLCMKAPSSVTGTQSSVTWDYITLRPCVLNDKDQRWIVKNNALYTADNTFKVQHYKWYATISKNREGFYNHTLVASMNTWINTIAQPPNLSIQTSLAWPFITSFGWTLYYIQNNASYLKPETLYYNPENGHIAQYNPSSGKLFCMYSQMSDSQDWNWVAWKPCTDDIPKFQDSLSWEPFLMNDNDGMLKDYQGNFLKVTQYGPNWGVPYTAKPNYYDSRNTPAFNFIFSQDINNWERYNNANLGDNLKYCPAPGKKIHITLFDSYKQKIENNVLKRNVRSLPRDFRLTQAWIQRLWDIARSTSLEQQSSIGICGVCLLHSYQMIAELQEYAYSTPLTSGGYFFDTQHNRNPFESLHIRFPNIEQRLTEARNFFRLPYQEGETQMTRLRRMIYAVSISMLPQYHWHVSEIAQTEHDIRGLAQSLFNASPGTLWIYFVMRSNAQGTGAAGHAQPMIRTQDGIVIIPTNTPTFDFDSFANAMIPVQNVEQIMEDLTLGGRRRIYHFAVAQITTPYENPMSFMISQYNCTGNGKDRRGSTMRAVSSLINQCSSGRCAIQ